MITADGLYACAASVADRTQQCVMLLSVFWSCCAGGDNHEEAYNAVYDDNNPPYDDDNKAKFSHALPAPRYRVFSNASAFDTASKNCSLACVCTN